jgi:hypothetical protein
MNTITLPTYCFLRYLGYNLVEKIAEGLLQNCPNLNQIELKGNPLKDVHPDAFINLPLLKKL